MIQRDGQEIEEAYTVDVPVTYVEEIAVQVFDGKGKRVDLNPTLVKAKRLDGSDIKPKQLASLLTRPQRVFRLPSFASFQPDPFYVGLIDPSTIVLFQMCQRTIMRSEIETNGHHLNGFRYSMIVRDAAHGLKGCLGLHEANHPISGPAT